MFRALLSVPHRAVPLLFTRMSGDSGTPAKVVTGKRGTGDSGFGTLEEDNNGPPTKQVKSNCPEQERGLTVSGTGTSLPCPDNTRVEDYQQTVRHEITEGDPMFVVTMHDNSMGCD